MRPEVGGGERGSAGQSASHFLLERRPDGKSRLLPCQTPGSQEVELSPCFANSKYETHKSERVEKTAFLYNFCCFIFSFFPLELRHLAQEIRNGILCVCHKRLLDSACNSAFIFTVCVCESPMSLLFLLFACKCNQTPPFT